MQKTYKKVDGSDLVFFQQLLESWQVLSLNDDLVKYSRDHTEDLQFFPELVLLPTNPQQIASILRYCNEHQIPVTARGAGTGLSGGALPVHQGIILSTEKLNRILKVDTENFQAILEPGVINEELQQEVSKYGLFYPPDPASKGSCFMGGNVSHASGGPRALKYGTTRDYILNLEVVLADGSVIWTGANTLKYSTGYNLTHLMIGSEGTLGIITKIVVRLIPAPTKNQLLLALFSDPVKACESVARVFMAGCHPSVFEFIEPEGFRLSSAYCNLSFDIPSDAGAYLLIEVDGHDEQLLQKECEQISEVLYQLNCIDILHASSTEQKEFFWKLRRTIGEATKSGNVYKEEDTVVPRFQLPELFLGVKSIAQKYHLRTVCYGHAGDGNLHVNILKDDHSDVYWNGEVKEAIREIFLLCHTLNGTISGEHGIGYVQKEFMPLVLSETNLSLMKGIKNVFDPHGILNPGKIF
ncbi:MAG TPA: FAD-linked oxidase C-terminal domain-containing protein [Chitinophagaceae bacterium]|nr:FAD-linked oxidase C-terminal domain-containing protein [Chitinophagaceae bacterium]